MARGRVQGSTRRSTRPEALPYSIDALACAAEDMRTDAPRNQVEGRWTPKQLADRVRSGAPRLGTPVPGSKSADYRGRSASIPASRSPLIQFVAAESGDTHGTPRTEPDRPRPGAHSLGNLHRLGHARRPTGRVRRVVRHADGLRSPHRV